MAEQGETILSDVKTLTIVANNHYRGKAVSAAARLKAAMTHEQVSVPPLCWRPTPTCEPSPGPRNPKRSRQVSYHRLARLKPSRRQGMFLGS